jgi:hypothetical protein
VPDLVVGLHEFRDAGAFDAAYPLDEVGVGEPALGQVLFDDMNLDTLLDEPSDVVGKSRRLRLPPFSERKSRGILAALPESSRSSSAWAPRMACVSQMIVSSCSSRVAR